MCISALRPVTSVRLNPSTARSSALYHLVGMATGRQQLISLPSFISCGASSASPSSFSEAAGTLFLQQSKDNLTDAQLFMGVAFFSCLYM